MKKTYSIQYSYRVNNGRIKNATVRVWASTHIEAINSLLNLFNSEEKLTKVHSIKPVSIKQLDAEAWEEDNEVSDKRL